MGYHYRKDDVEFHSDYGREARPAVNVKCYRGIDSVTLPLSLGFVKDIGESDFREVLTVPAFTLEWVEGYLEANPGAANDYWQFACEDGWEQLQSVAEDIWGKVKVYAEGRMGGWAIVEGINDFDSWDALDLSKWYRFEKSAKAIAADIPRAILEGIYANAFEAEEATV